MTELTLKEDVNCINDVLKEAMLTKTAYTVADINEDLNTVRDIPIPLRTLAERFTNRKDNEYISSILNSFENCINEES